MVNGLSSFVPILLARLECDICSMLLARFFREDIFTFQGKDYIGALRSVSIKRDNSGHGSAWYLEKVND